MKLPTFSLDDVQARPLVVMCACLIVVCGYLLNDYRNVSNRDNDRLKAENKDCEERLDRLTTQVIVLMSRVNKLQKATDSMEVRSKLMLELSKKQ